MIKNSIRALFCLFLFSGIFWFLCEIPVLALLRYDTRIEVAFAAILTVISMKSCIRKNSIPGPELLADGSPFHPDGSSLLTETTDPSGLISRTYATPDAQIFITTTRSVVTSNRGSVWFATFLAFVAFFWLRGISL